MKDKKEKNGAYYGLLRASREGKRRKGKDHTWSRWDE